MNKNKTLTFKISNMLEEQGMLDVSEDGQIANADEVLEARIGRETDDDAYRRSNSSAFDDFNLCFTNVSPILPLTPEKSARVSEIIWMMLKGNPMHCSKLESVLKTTRLYAFNRGKGHAVEIRQLIKYLIDNDFLRMDESLKLNVVDEKDVESRIWNIVKDLDYNGL